MDTLSLHPNRLEQTPDQTPKPSPMLGPLDESDVPGLGSEEIIGELYSEKGNEFYILQRRDSYSDLGTFKEVVPSYAVQPELIEEYKHKEDTVDSLDKGIISETVVREVRPSHLDDRAYDGQMWGWYEVSSSGTSMNDLHEVRELKREDEVDPVALAIFKHVPSVTTCAAYKVMQTAS